MSQSPDLSRVGCHSYLGDQVVIETKSPVHKLPIDALTEAVFYLPINKRNGKLASFFIEDIRISSSLLYTHYTHPVDNNLREGVSKLMDMRCPRCQNPHTVKATSIIHSGNTMSSTTGGAVAVGFGGAMVGSYSGTTHAQSMLAGKLQPPVPPRRASPVVAIILLIISLVIGIIPAITVMVAYADMDAFLKPSASDYENTTLTPKEVELRTREDGLNLLHHCEWVLGITIVVIIACIVWMILAAPRRKAVYQHHLSRWQRAMYNWDQLYYCNICDSVYLQTTRQFASLDTMHGLLFSA